MPNRRVLHLRLSQQTRGCVNIHFDESITRIVLCNGANNFLIHQWTIYIYNLQGYFIFGVKEFWKSHFYALKNIFMHCYFLLNFIFKFGASSAIQVLIFFCRVSLYLWINTCAISIPKQFNEYVNYMVSKKNRFL